MTIATATFDDLQSELDNLFNYISFFGDFPIGKLILLGVFFAVTMMLLLLSAVLIRKQPFSLAIRIIKQFFLGVVLTMTVFGLPYGILICMKSAFESVYAEA